MIALTSGSFKDPMWLGLRKKTKNWLDLKFETQVFIELLNN